jgi:hypothetical protein
MMEQGMEPTQQANSRRKIKIATVFNATIATFIIGPYHPALSSTF